MNACKYYVLVLLLFFVSGVSAQPAFKDCPDCPEMVVIPAGSFVMGSEKQDSAKPLHTVTLRSFLIGKTEVTQRHWASVMGNNPSYYSRCGPDCPVENVSWNDAQQFILKLNQKTGKRYRLPSEAEWEYAARGGATDAAMEDENEAGKYAWQYQNSGGKTHEVGQKMPNEFGLHDMYGNVMEWVADCHHKNYVGAPTDGSAWTTACNNDWLVQRGGGVTEGNNTRGFWNRFDFRGGSRPYFRNQYWGFRLAREHEDAAPQGLGTANSQAKTVNDQIHDAKRKCDEIGFEAGTEAYGKCVLKLSK